MKIRSLISQNEIYINLEDAMKDLRIEIQECFKDKVEPETISSLGSALMFLQIVHDQLMNRKS